MKIRKNIMPVILTVKQGLAAAPGWYFGVCLDMGRSAITEAYIIIIAVFQQVTASGSDGPSI